LNEELQKRGRKIRGAANESLPPKETMSKTRAWRGLKGRKFLDLKQFKTDQENKNKPIALRGGGKTMNLPRTVEDLQQKKGDSVRLP